ncbi:transporter, major facilitator family protein [Rhodococcus erythropolis SK121]|nr:transporter, major facilitator family protein [Rhodococcus erythropolis SK121]
MTHTATRPVAGRINPTAILAIILISYFMILLDNSIIFTGLPSIQSSMGYSATGLSWVQDAYTLVFGGLLLLGARLGDIFGRRRVFVAGLAIFAIASFLVGVAPNGWWLIAARALQGVGAAVVAPASLSLLTASFPPGPERTRAVAWYGAAAGIGASLGLVIGGALADWVSWRAGFFINVPIGIAMIALAPRFIPGNRAQLRTFRCGGRCSRHTRDDRARLRHRQLGRSGVDLTDHRCDTGGRGDTTDLALPQRSESGAADHATEVVP